MNKRRVTSRQVNTVKDLLLTSYYLKSSQSKNFVLSELENHEYVAIITESILCQKVECFTKSKIGVGWPITHKTIKI